MPFTYVFHFVYLDIVNEMKLGAPYTLLKKTSPITGLEWLRSFQEVKVPKYPDNGTGWW